MLKLYTIWEEDYELPEKKWYAMEIHQVCQELNSDLHQGLNQEEANERLKIYGPNVLKEPPPRSLFSMFIGQLKEILVLILIGAAIISGILGEWEDSIVILVIVMLNAVLGVYQENKAEQALKALKEMTKPAAKVVRNGMVTQVDAGELVPGDIVLLDAGDFVPADARLIEAVSLRANEAALTGESVPVEKDPAMIAAGEVPVGDRKNMLFMGTIITSGRGKALVVETGMNTQLGRIAQLLQETPLEPTPLQRRLNELGKTLGMAAGVIVALVFATGLWRGEDVLDMFMTAISLAVAAVPEGLPAVVTIVLALGVTRMSQRQAVIRKLPAVETLGTATVICSDKTGTLTKNEMTVTQIYTAGNFLQVTGTGYQPDGRFLNQQGNEIAPLTDRNLELMLLGGLLNSDARLEATEKGYRVIGDPTEGALVVVAAKAGLIREKVEKTYPRLAEIPFDSARKMMTTFHHIDGSIQSFTKGAPDVLLARSTGVMTGQGIEPLTGEMRTRLLQINSQLASQGQRVLALAVRRWPEIPAGLSPDTAEQDLTFVGFYAMQDPPRPEVKEAVAVSGRAGIRTVMITGDHQETAMAIAKELGIWKQGDGVLTGAQLDQMDDQQLKEVVNRVTVYARVSPEDKLRIVAALKEHKHVVAMTGDGVNDAPALKRADIGAAMGITGTEVAKEASDMVLLDDNFATIVNAVEEGRTIYDNIRKSIQYLLSCNTGEIVAIFSAILLGLGSPLTPIQILWLNLVTDGPPALALGLEPPEKGVMDRPPRKPKEGVFAGGMGINIVWQGTMIGLLALFSYWLALSWGRTLDEAHTMAFVTMALSQLVHSFNVRSMDQSLLSIGLGTNRSLMYAFLASISLQVAVVLIPFLRGIFETAVLRTSDWAVVLSLSLVPLVAVEISKLLGKLIVGKKGRL
ncbi:Cation-transporting P-type ATPase [Moorella glycerini]|uniref:P-type Ca(2+) transporter n=1 Tax=Neomoorella stamsii TaxID=1266720 RepID=A0A9X7P644_9FIRM|nr:Calcium-transporting ATPase 1 [Moorella stamsii]CEP68082.1 Cation-transporting P-type ATPase [Moorella glycerini]